MTSFRPELGAVLDHACLLSEDPQRLAGFLEKAYGLSCEQVGNGWHCIGPDRTLLVEEGPANRLGYFAYAFESADRLGGFRQGLEARALTLAPSPSAFFDDSAFSFRDPDGNVVVFGTRARSSNDNGEFLPARLQHVAFRTPDVDRLVAFYETLGFVVSDRVECEEGVLRACFLRSDREHHALALFRASDARFDHLSCETRDVGAVVAWADRMAKHGIAIHWGIGRHGPGNDLFFMVKDPDGNLLEISAELEQCPPERPPGRWRHEQRTLNLWGNAILRS
jgi:catechol 2,3-dioxygenase